jgi:hypothetical protein
MTDELRKPSGVAQSSLEGFLEEVITKWVGGDDDKQHSGRRGRESHSFQRCSLLTTSNRERVSVELVGLWPAHGSS